MSICINCNTQNPNNNLFCQQCSSELLLEGRYRANHQLGAGGFGATYEVSDQGTTKVLKVLRNNSDTAIRLFQREAKFLASNNYPGIPKAEHNSYFQFQPKNSQQQIHCLVMEKIDGVNLKEYIKQSGKPIKGDLGLQWLREMVEILDRVHSQDIIHRDIKPQNIMLQPDGKLVLIDFGAVTDEGIVEEGTETATATSGTQTATHTAGGTRIYSKDYTAPEQMNGQPIKQSDIYSLGRTFVYLLTAKKPNNPIMYDVYNDQINWRQYAQQVPPQLADLIDSMIKRVPNQRPANTQVILQRLNQLNGNQSQASPTDNQSTDHQKEEKSKGNLLLLVGGFIGIAVVFVGVVANLNNKNLPVNNNLEPNCYANIKIKNNIRSEPNSKIGNAKANIISQASENYNNFSLTGTKTHEGWNQVNLPGGDIGWVHDDALATPIPSKCITQRVNDLDYIKSQPVNNNSNNNPNPEQYDNIPEETPQNQNQTYVDANYGGNLEACIQDVMKWQNTVWTYDSAKNHCLTPLSKIPPE